MIRLLLLALPILSLGCNKTIPQTDSGVQLPAITVTAEPIKTRSIQRTVQAVGTFQGYEEATLVPKVDGRVLATFADIGDWVYPGEVLLEIDPTDLRLEVQSAHHAFEVELAKLGLTELPEEEFDIAAVPFVAKADATLENALTEYNRLNNPENARLSSAREKQNAEMEYKVAKAGKLDSEAQARALLSTARLRKSALEQAEQRLRDTKLRVPYPHEWWAWSAILGPPTNPHHYEVARKLISEGEMVRSMMMSDSFRLVLDAGLKLPLMLPEQFIPKVKLGQAVVIRVDAYPDRTFQGEVRRISPTVDPRSRVFAVIVGVPNLAHELRSGGFAQAEILLGSDTVLTVPSEAVLTFAGVNKIFIIEGNNAKAIEVELGSRDKEWTEVRGDIPTDARVITSGLTQLVDGSAITVRTQSSTAPH